MRRAGSSLSSWGQALALTAALSIVAWRSYVVIMGEDLRATYNFGGNALKWFVISFFEPFVQFVLIPLIVVGAGSLMLGAVRGRASLLRSYVHGLVAPAAWLSFGLYGLWYSHQ